MPFKKGDKKPEGTGRGKGTPNKLTKTVREAVEIAFNEMQKDPTKKYSLKKWAEENPKDFYLIAAKLIPVQVTGANDEPIQIKVIRGANG